MEDDMQVCKNDINVTRIRVSSTENDIHLLEESMGNAHQGIEDLGDRVDGFVSSLRTYQNQYTASHRSLFQEMHHHKREARMDHENILGKFARTGEVIDKKFVQVDTELEKVVGLVRDKIEKEVRKIANEFVEAMEVEEEWRATSESKVASLEGRLEEALGAISALMTLVVALQGRVGGLEDAVMEEALSRLVPFGHVFGPLLSSFRTKFTRYSKSLCKKTTKTSYKQIVLQIQQ
jgi:hypothetical protein